MPTKMEKTHSLELGCLGFNSGSTCWVTLDFLTPLSPMFLICGKGVMTV